MCYYLPTTCQPFGPLGIVNLGDKIKCWTLLSHEFAYLIAEYCTCLPVYLILVWNVVEFWISVVGNVVEIILMKINLWARLLQQNYNLHCILHSAPVSDHLSLAAVTLKSHQLSPNINKLTYLQTKFCSCLWKEILVLPGFFSVSVINFCFLLSTGISW